MRLLGVPLPSAPDLLTAKLYGQKTRISHDKRFSGETFTQWDCTTFLLDSATLLTLHSNGILEL